MTQLEAPETAAPEATKLGRKRDPSRDAEILNATLDVLAEYGYDGMTIDMVAARAKAGKATVYRRWESKSELVIDAVACMKGPVDFDALPDTGTLRGDLVAMIKPPTIADAERKIKIMSGLMSLMQQEPELAETAHLAIMEPRKVMNRVFLQRAIDRGEIRADTDIDLIATISSAMVNYRTLMQRKPVDRAFLISIVDEIVLPAVRKS
jgi:AcrR family transcriptional regulator